MEEAWGRAKEDEAGAHAILSNLTRPHSLRTNPHLVPWLHATVVPSPTSLLAHLRGNDCYVWIGVCRDL